MDYTTHTGSQGTSHARFEAHFARHSVTDGDLVTGLHHTPGSAGIDVHAHPGACLYQAFKGESHQAALSVRAVFCGVEGLDSELLKMLAQNEVGQMTAALEQERRDLERNQFACKKE